MKEKRLSGFDEYWEEVLRAIPAIAKDFSRRLPELPLATQLAIMRRRRGLSQSDVAKSMGVKQPHVARIERASHDPRISSVEAYARAIRCRVMLVPDKYFARVWEKLGYTEAELGGINKLAEARGG